MTSVEPSRHRLNTSFEWPTPTPPFTAITDAQAEHFDEHGFLVIDDVFSPDEIAAVTAVLDQRDAEVEAFLAGMENERFSIAEAGAITFAPNLAHRDDVLRSFATHPRLLGLCSDLVGDDVDLYWDQAVYKKPQKPRRFPWHQDNGYTLVDPQYYLTCWVALTDATVDNGCPQVAPGLHRLGTLEHHYIDPLGWQIFDEASDVEVAPVRAGGVVVFSSLTPHLTGPNTTPDVRKAYILQYSPAGAVIVSNDGGETIENRPVADGPHVFPVLRGGEPA